MKKLPEEVLLAWENRDGPIVLATVNQTGTPNIIYASMVSMTNDGRIAVADNYFDKTLANIHSGSTASVLFITKTRKAYQVKGRIEYDTDGPLFREMLTWADQKHPRKGVAIINAKEVYKGKDRLA
jgi:predicted pyridoxine 5'-phosphate oxidase superfamily flavin-nucleotide-binding protein